MSAIKLDKGLSIFCERDILKNSTLWSLHERTHPTTLQFAVYLSTPLLQIRYLTGHSTQVLLERGQERVKRV